MSEIDEILDYLGYIHQQHRPLSLVNIYQGVSLSLEVQIQQISGTRKNMVVAARHGRPISLLPATQIQIHSDLFPRPLQSKVESVDVHHRSAILGSFSYIKSKSDSRKETRYQPKIELSATVKIGDQFGMKGLVNDISVEGISLILVRNDIDLSEVFPPNTSVRLIYNLPVSNQIEPVEISTPAKVTYINTLKPNEQYRVGFITYPQDHQRNILRRYFFDRQTEMFNDLSQDSSTREGTAIIL